MNDINDLAGLAPAEGLEAQDVAPRRQAARQRRRPVFASIFACAGLYTANFSKCLRPLSGGVRSGRDENARVEALGRLKQGALVGASEGPFR